MATLSNGGRITEDIVDNEIKRLQIDWNGGGSNESKAGENILSQVLSKDAREKLDLFDRIQ